MAKLFFTQVPTVDEIQNYISNSGAPSADGVSINSYLVMRKLQAELEDSLDCYFSDYNLSSGRFIILQLLYDSPQGLMPSDLAEKVGVTQATISGLINNLSKANLLERQQHHQDGRAFVIKLTEQGRELISKIQPDFFAKISSLMQTLTTEEQKLLNSISNKLLGKVSTLCSSKTN